MYKLYVWLSLYIKGINNLQDLEGRQAVEKVLISLYLDLIFRSHFFENYLFTYVHFFGHSAQKGLFCSAYYITVNFYKYENINTRLYYFILRKTHQNEHQQFTGILKCSLG